MKKILDTIKQTGFFFVSGISVSLLINIIFIIIKELIVIIVDFEFSAKVNFILTVIKDILIYIVYTGITVRIIFERSFGEKRVLSNPQLFIAFGIYCVSAMTYFEIFGTEFSLGGDSFLIHYSRIFFSGTCSPLLFLTHFIYNPAFAILIPSLVIAIIYYCAYNNVFNGIYSYLNAGKDKRIDFTEQQRLLFLIIGGVCLLISSTVLLLNDILYTVGYIFLLLTMSQKKYILVYDGEITINENYRLRKIFMIFALCLCIYSLISTSAITIEASKYFIFSRDTAIPVLNIITIVLLCVDIRKYLYLHYETKIILFFKRFRTPYIIYIILFLMIKIYYLDSHTDNLYNMIVFFSVLSFIFAGLFGYNLFLIYKEQPKFKTYRIHD